jgi:WD40 repeat protein
MSGDGGTPETVAFNPSGSMLASGEGNGVVYLWRVTPPELSLGGLGGLYGDPNLNSTVMFMNSGKTVETVIADGIVDRWNPVSGRLEDHESGTLARTDYAFELSPNGQLLAGGGNGQIQLWNLASRREEKVLRIGNQTFSNLLFSPNGRFLLGGTDSGIAWIWKLSNWQIVSGPFKDGSIIAYGPNGNLMAVSTKNGATHLFDVSSRRPMGVAISPPGQNSYMVAMSPHGNEVAVSPGPLDVQIWPGIKGIPVGQPVTLVGSGNVGAMGFSPDGSELATTSEQDSVQLWDSATGKPIGPPLSAVNPADMTINAIKFNPSGDLLAVATNDGSVQVWQISYITNAFKEVCAVANQSLTPAVWHLDAPEIPYRHVCP